MQKISDNAALDALARRFDVSAETISGRITELEIKLSFSEDQLDALNKTVFLQQRQIDSLQQDMRALREQAMANLPAEQTSLRDEMPPHY